MHEWSLVFFTLLVQSAVGLVVVGEVVRATTKGDMEGQLSKQFPVAAGLTGFGLVLSMTHLGNPLHSIFTIFNIGSSWLSREILSTGLFFALLIATTFLGRKGRHNSVLGALTAIVGLITVFVMSRVYMLSSVPVWNSGATPLAFFGSAFLIGAILCALLLSPGWQGAAEKDFGNSFGVTIAIAALGIPMGILAGSDLNAHGVSSLNTVVSYGESIFFLRIVLLTAGGLLFAWGGVRAILKTTSSKAFVVVATICAVTGEVIGRVLFYASYARIGL